MPPTGRTTLQYMEIQIDKQEERFFESLEELRQAPTFMRPQRLERLMSAVDALQRTAGGMRFLYHELERLLEADVFGGSLWADPGRLVPGLVGGTLVAGHPSSTMEVLSELRLLALAEGRGSHVAMSTMQARQFLEDAIVANFELLFEDFAEPSWQEVSGGERQKIDHLFSLLLEFIPLDALKGKIHEVVQTLVAHRPVVTTRVEKMLRVVDKRLNLSPTESPDRQLLRFVEAFLHPSELANRCGDAEAYAIHLSTLDPMVLQAEARRYGQHLKETGLVSDFHLRLLRYLAAERPELVPEVLQLDAHGRAEFERHRSFILLLIGEFIQPALPNALYGLARVLERNLLSRPITWNALNRLLRVEVHPRVEKVLLKANHTTHPATAHQLLIGGTLSVLGHPLGVRQGNNPTCQSARGISMWSRHAPGKLINLLIDAATADNLSFRFEGELVESSKTGPGLVHRFDYKLDPVSVVLVPHLDRIYNFMMQRAAAKHVGDDPHVFVNPAFYGQWIQTGFISVYNPLTGAIEGYERFVRIFFASFHPEYNGGHHLAYPVPLGIFITDAAANMLGYHAVSLLRIDKDATDTWRAYFFNPNSEGRQQWGQGIEPSVAGHGEEAGESSLPVFEFASRVYAYHYNTLRLGQKAADVPGSLVDRVMALARESWGRKYTWKNH